MSSYNHSITSLDACSNVVNVGDNLFLTMLCIYIYLNEISIYLDRLSTFIENTEINL